MNVAGKKRPPAGDEIILKQPVRRGSTRTGHEYVTIRPTGGQTGQIHADPGASWRPDRRGGLQLTSQNRFTLAITGHTGGYVGASGQVRVHMLHTFRRQG